MKYSISNIYAFISYIFSSAKDLRKDKLRIESFLGILFSPCASLKYVIIYCAFQTLLQSKPPLEQLETMILLQKSIYVHIFYHKLRNKSNHFVSYHLTFNIG